MLLRKNIVLVFAFMFGLSACTYHFDEINTDPNRLEKIDPSTLMTPTLYDLANYVDFLCYICENKIQYL